MLKEKRYIKKKPIRLLRIPVMVLGFACILLINYRECASNSDKPIRDKASSGLRFASNLYASILEDFQATAYCVTGITKSGVPVAPGHVAADPRVIPLGSVIYVETPTMSGVYHVLDTGKLIKGKIIDIFIPSYQRCKEFGRRMVKIKVLRYGFESNSPPKPPNT
jgi:3D (Asp-Asp-Asp) domain-containing protein